MKSLPCRVLVVEDDERIGNLILAILTGLGSWCIWATDGVDALAKMKESKIDAVVTDIKLPKMDGITLTGSIVKQYPRLPIMVMTGSSDEDLAEAAISAGAQEFIQKPFSEGEFTIRFKKMIRESQTVRKEDVGDVLTELEETLKRV